MAFGGGNFAFSNQDANWGSHNWTRYDWFARPEQHPFNDGTILPRQLRC